MCLIVLAWRALPDFPLVVAANRDEFHARPAARAGFWEDHPAILAGRDLEAHGTWMGVTRGGRFAAVTNYRGGRDANAKESRGALVTGFLSSDLNSKAFVAKAQKTRDSYSGFNLLVADGEELWWLSNRDGGSRRLEPGIYGLGNLLLDTPEVAGAKEQFARALDPAPSVEPLFGVLAAAKIVAPEYGTRCSTVLMQAQAGEVRFAERPFDAAGSEGATVHHQFRARR